MDTNMAQALKMAGGVLIAIIIIATLTYFFRELTPFQQQVEDIKELEQTAEFNKQYEVYNKSLMLGVDLISVLNKAANNNKAYIDAYGTGDAIRNHYLIDIEFELKTNNSAMLYVFKIENDGKEREIHNSYETEFGSNSTPYKDEIFGALDPENTIDSVGRDTLWRRQELRNLPDGNYTLLNEDMVDYMYCNEQIYKSIIVNATNMRKIVKNVAADFEIDEWSQAILSTSAYELKTKKFTCTNVENSDVTGRITKMVFEEL